MLVLWIAGVKPTKNSQRAKRVPAAGLADGFGEWEGEGLGVGIVEEPAAVGLALAFNELDRFGHARVGLPTGCPEIIERAENVVVVARRESEFEEFGIGDFAGGAASEERTFEQIFFGTVAGGGNFGCVRVVSLLRQFR